MRWLARACTVLMLVVIGASAWLRLEQPRPVCLDWPACRDAASSAAPMAMASSGTAGQTVVRGVHRLAASTTLLLLIVLAVQATGRRVRGGLPLVVALLALALGLSALGIVSPGSRALPVVLGNLLGGFAMLALSWALARRLGTAAAVGSALRRGAALAAALWLAQAALGAASGLGAAAGVVPLLHAMLGFAAATAALLVGLLSWNAPHRTEGRALVLLAGAQLLLGAVTAAQGAGPGLVLAHNAAAAIGLAVCCGLALARR